MHSSASYFANQNIPRGAQLPESVTLACVTSLCVWFLYGSPAGTLPKFRPLAKTAVAMSNFFSSFLKFSFRFSFLFFFFFQVLFLELSMCYN